MIILLRDIIAVLLSIVEQSIMSLLLWIANTAVLESADCLGSGAKVRLNREWRVVE